MYHLKSFFQVFWNPFIQIKSIDRKFSDVINKTSILEIIQVIHLLLVIQLFWLADNLRNLLIVESLKEEDVKVKLYGTFSLSLLRVICMMKMKKITCVSHLMDSINFQLFSVDNYFPNFFKKSFIRFMKIN